MAYTAVYVVFPNLSYTYQLEDTAIFQIPLYPLADRCRKCHISSVRPIRKFHFSPSEGHTSVSCDVVCIILHFLYSGVGRISVKRGYKIFTYIVHENILVTMPTYYIIHATFKLFSLTA